MMNGKGVFDHQDEALLIDLVRQHPSLWNTSDSNFQKKGVKKLLYTQISEELKKMWPDKAHLLSADAVRHKFNTLKSYFLREERKMKAWDKLSPVRQFPTWIHFDRLLFVSEKDGENESECDLNISAERVEELSNDDKEMEHNDNIPEHNDSIPDTICSDSNEGKDSFLLQSSVQSGEGTFKPAVKIEIPDDSTTCSNGNVETDSSLLLQSHVRLNDEAFKPSVKIEVPDDTYPVDISFMTDTSDNAVVAEASCSDRNERTNSSLSLQPNDGIGPFLKERNTTDSSPMPDSLNIETPVNTVFAEATYSASNEEANSTPPLQSYVLLNNEAIASPKAKNLSNSSPVCDSTETETPVPAVMPEISCPSNTVSKRTESSPSLQPPLQTNENAVGSPLKRKKLLLLHRVTPPFLDKRSFMINKKKKLNTTSPMCDSTFEQKTPVILNTWSASPHAPPPFHVTLGNLVASSLNQMPANKANAATKAILDVLLKYGKETNHPR